MKKPKKRSCAEEIVRSHMRRIVEGGPGSGFRGHKGRPGQVGGSTAAGARKGFKEKPPKEGGDIGKKIGKLSKNKVAKIVVGSKIRVSGRWGYPNGITGKVISFKPPNPKWKDGKGQGWMIPTGKKKAIHFWGDQATTL